ncbi:MAG: sensor histidine kinase, partial [Sporomusa sp.]
CFTPTTLFTRFPVALSIIFTIFVVYVLLAAVIGIIQGRLMSPLSRTSIILLTIGLVIAVLFSAINIYTFQRGVQLLNLDYHVVGILVFLLLNMLALTLGFAHTEEQLHEVRRSEEEIKKTNEMLERLNRARIQFIEKISHEMKTPLAVMGSSAGRTLSQIRRNTVDEETEKNLDAIQHESIRLGRLVEQLMALSLEEERQLTRTWTDAMTLMRKAADFCTPICEGSGNHVAILGQSDLIPIMVDEDSFLQVFIIIANANKHTQNDSILLSAELNDRQDMVVFQVSDNGSGIEPEFLDSIWKPGVSGDGGTGLGLSICKEIIEEHRGEITAQSEIGASTLIRFTLPVQRAEE